MPTASVVDTTVAVAAERVATDYSSTIVEFLTSDVTARTTAVRINVSSAGRCGARTTVVSL